VIFFHIAPDHIMFYEDTQNRILRAYDGGRQEV
jgi:hypothetical protein